MASTGRIFAPTEIGIANRGTLVADRGRMPTIEYEKQLDTAGTEWLRIRIRTHRGQLINFTLQYETMIGGVPHPVVRYDCAHGFVHVDFMDRTGAQVAKRPLSSGLTLKQAVHEAEADLIANWERYRAQFLGAPK